MSSNAKNNSMISIDSSKNKDNKKKETKENKLKKNDADSDSDSGGDESEYDSDNSDDYETISDTDSSYRPPTKKRINKRRIVDTEDEESEDETDYTEDDEEEESDEDDDHNKEGPIDEAELQKYISRIFPSKYMKDRANKSSKKYDKKSDKKSNKKSDKKSDKKTEKKNDKKSDKKTEKKSDKKSNKKYSDTEESDYDDEDEETNAVNDKGQYGFIFTLDGEEEDDDCVYNEEEDDAECNSEDEETFMKENYQKLEPVTSPETNDKKDKKDKKTKKNKKDKKDKEKDVDIDLTDVEQEYLELVDTKKDLVEAYRAKPKSKILKEAIADCDESIKKLVKKSRAKNAKTYHKLIHDDKKRTNEIDYFKKKLSNKEQLRVMKDLKEINKHINIEKPYRLTLLDTKMPAKFKAIALQKLNILKTMEPGDNEYYKIKNWVDTFMRIPFGVYKSLSVKMDDGMDICNEFMENAKTTLDTCTYGLNDAKMQIMQFLGQWIANPASLGSAIAIHGPMGTGKTSIVKEGISKILGREFAFIALGGAGDSSFLEGHSYTYEGSSWGRILQIIIDSKCMNPVIYFDELDKISDTPRGEEIIGILTHLIDTSQNSQYHDKYFSEIDFDLSKCLFIFSYNDESKVNPILRDRMYRIQTKGYESKEKIIIAKDYLLPKIREQVNFAEGDVIIPDDTVQYIVSSTYLTKNESGVRNLKRCLEIIHTKLNLFRLVKPESALFGKDMKMEVKFPFTVSRKDVDILIKNEEEQNQSLLAMYV
uniref:AAA+ ATPase domain-containing protein n=1 Tax=viral metagenome TaxID=1070528 RepID=A0A6C0HTQ0_9ZZZZ